MILSPGIVEDAIEINELVHVLPLNKGAAVGQKKQTKY